jgi:hypothetical protein
MAQWYAAIGSQQYGPVDEDQLRKWIAEGRVGPASYVWKEGMPDWLPLSQVPGLFQPAPVAPPQRRRRGAAVLILGLAGLVCCCVPYGVVSIITGVIAAVMGAGDLRLMNRGQMDDSGRGLTTAGMIFGIISILLGIVVIIVTLIYGPWHHWHFDERF